MGRWRLIFRNLLFGLLMLLGVGVCAQEPRLNRAQKLYNEKSYDLAAKVIDSVVVDPQTSRDFISWTLRAYIYYYIYVRTDKSVLNSRLRDTVEFSIRKSIALNPDSNYVNNNSRILNSLSVHYFNIAKSLLQDSLDYDRSGKAYQRYKDMLKLTSSTIDPNSRDLEYYLAVGSVFSDKFNHDSSDTKALEHAKVALMKVLDMQPDNPSANLNLGLLYYNQAANISKEMDYGVDFELIDIMQDNMVKLAKQSEQFIFKVYNNDNKNRKACTALFYIYRMLLDYNKSDIFKKKAEALGERFSESGSGSNGDNTNNKTNDK